MKEQIINKLKDYHSQQGIVFLSKEDAEDYFRGLVELIEDLYCAENYEEIPQFKGTLDQLNNL